MLKKKQKHKDLAINQFRTTAHKERVMKRNFYEYRNKYLNIEEITKTTNKSFDKGQLLAMLEALYLSIDNQLNKLLDLKLKELIDDETYKSKKDHLTSEKLSIQKNMESDIYSQDYRRNKVIEMFDFCREAQDLFDKGDFKQKQIVLKALGSRFYL